MSIDVLKENVIALRDAAVLLPARRRGKRPHVSCLYRWTTTGCRGVTLESVDVGGTRCTSREAIARFVDRLSALRTGARSMQNEHAVQESDRNAVNHKLDDLGIR
jgi:hypothetical protein